jgi:hypothetical protein
MRLLTFALFVVLLSLIALLGVHAEVERIRSGYRKGRLLGKRERLRLRMIEVKAEIAELVAPGRLMRLNRELGMDLVPLGVRPAPMAASRNVRRD